MRKIILLLFFVNFIIIVRGQSACNPGTIPTVIYYPNSTYPPTTNIGYEYLCGPNTIVYDTLGGGCHFIYVSSNCTLFFTSDCSCAAASYIWLKNNSILNLKQGNCPLQIFYEPLAIINNPYSVTFSSFSCTAISFPTVNCTLTGIKENNLNTAFEIYPNPTNDKLHIQGNINIHTLQIINSLGQVSNVTVDYVYDGTINVENLPNGIYILNITDISSSTHIKRFVINH